MQEFLSLNSHDVMYEKDFKDMMNRFNNIDLLEEMKIHVNRFMSGQTGEFYENMFDVISAVHQVACGKTKFKFFHYKSSPIKVFHGEYSYYHTGTQIEIQGNNDTLLSKCIYVISDEPKKEKGNMFLKNISYKQYTELLQLAQEKEYDYIEDVILEKIASEGRHNRDDMLFFLHRLNLSKNMRLAPLSDLLFSTICDGEKYYIMQSRHLMNIFVFLTESEYAKVKLGS